MSKDKGIFEGEDETIEHVVTDEDLVRHPELIKEGIVVGDTVELSVEDAVEWETPTPKQEDVVEEVKVEAVTNSTLPEWARAEGVQISKEDEKNFFPPEVPTKVVRTEETPEWAKA